MNQQLLEPYLLHIAAVQGALPREQCEELIRLGRAAGSPRERLVQKGGLAPEYIDGLLHKHADAVSKRYETAFAVEAQRLGYATKESVEECLKALQEFASKGFKFTLDELIVKRGVLSADQAVQIRMIIEKEIIICPVCLALFRNAMKMDLADIQCVKCKAKFSPSTMAPPETSRSQAPTVSEQAVLTTEPGQMPERIGDYRILAELGRGGMGVVYEAEQISLKRKVALKVAPASLALNTEAIERFHREAQALAKIKHANIVQVFGSGQYAGSHFYAMEFVEGKRIDEMLRETRADLRKSAEIGRQIAEALQAAHEARVIHRDIKPSNIIVDGKGQAHLMDFGLARGDEDVGLTREGFAVGTPAYMAPEQAMGKRSLVGPLSDVYSLGATLYTMIAGHAPYLGQTPEAILTQVVSRDPISPVKWNKAITVELETIVLKSMQRDPAKRYAGAKAMAEDLSRFIAGEAISARPISAVEKLLRFIRRNRALFFVGAGTGLAGLVVVLIILLSANKKREEATQIVTQAGETVQKAEEDKKKQGEEHEKELEAVKQKQEEERKNKEAEKKKKEEAEAKAEEEKKKREEADRKAEEEKKKAEAETREREFLAAISKETQAVQAKKNEAETLVATIQASAGDRRGPHPQLEVYRKLLAMYAEITTWLDRVADPELKERLAKDDGFKALLDVSAETTTAKVGLNEERAKAAWIMFRKEGRHEDALKEIDELLKEDPANLRAMDIKARMLYRQKKVAEADKLYKAILEKSPRNENANLGLAEIYLDRKDYKNALPHLEMAEEVAPGTADLRALRAEYHYGLKQYEKALEYLQKQSWGNSRGGEGAVIKARCYLALKKPREAVESLEMMIGWMKQLKTADTEAFTEHSETERKEARYQIWLVHGEALLECGRKEDARESLENALKEKPGDAVAKKLLDKAKK